MKRLFLFLFLMTGIAFGQTTTYTGTIKDLSLNVVTSGQVSFVLTPATSSTIPGTGVFTPSEIDCNINTDGTLAGGSGGACVVASNTSLSPGGTSYRICVQPYYATPGSCFYDYATTDSKDISTVAPTLSTGPINYGGVPGPVGPTGPQGPIGAPTSGVNLTPGASQTVVQPSGTALGINYLNATDLLNGLDPTQWVQVPKPQLLTWRMAKAYASVLGQDIIIYSDSRARCDQNNCGVGPSLSTQRWPDIMAQTLWSAYGYGGTGAIPLIPFIGSTTLDKDVYTISGSWTTDPRLGPSQTGLRESGYSLVTIANGDVLTFTTPLTYDRVNVYCMTTTGSESLAIAIDGVAEGTACGTPSSSPTAVLATSTVVLPGVHVTTLTCTTGTCYVYALEGQNGTTGIRVHNLSVGSAASAWWGQSPSTSFAFSDLIAHNGTNYIPLTITDLLTNDASMPDTVANFQAHITTILNHERAGTTVASSEVVMVAPVSSVSGIATYTAALLPIAHSFGAQIVNVQSDWGSTYNAAAAVWTNPTQDGEHPGLAGTNGEAAMMLQSIIDFLPAFSQTQPVLAIPSPPPASVEAGYNNINTLHLQSTTALDAGVNVEAQNGFDFGIDLGYVATDLWGVAQNKFGTRRLAPNNALLLDCFYPAGTSPTSQSPFTCPFIVTPTGIFSYVPLLTRTIKSGTASNTDLVGVLTLSGGVATQTYTGTYAVAPICTSNDLSALAAVQPVSSTGGLTVHGTGSDVVSYICVARN